MVGVYKITSHPPYGEDFHDWVFEQLTKIQGAFEDTSQVTLKKLYAAPTKPRNGMVVYADGTTWNPGSGEGYYGYRGGTWNFLG